MVEMEGGGVVGVEGEMRVMVVWRMVGLGGWGVGSVIVRAGVGVVLGMYGAASAACGL